MKQIKTAMIVDDSLIDHIISERTIKQFDAEIEILHAHDGQEALDLLASEKSPPDLVLLDINMPGMDGHEFLLACAAGRYKNAFVSMMTSSDQRSDIERCLNYAFVKDYIVKPLSKTHLESIAEKLG